MSDTASPTEKQALAEIIACAAARLRRDAVGIGAIMDVYGDIAEAAVEALSEAGYVIVPREPTAEMLRALLVHHGYDPDAKEETLDRLGQLDIATMGVFVGAYRALIGAAGR